MQNTVYRTSITTTAQITVATHLRHRLTKVDALQAGDVAPFEGARLPYSARASARATFLRPRSFA
jgi:hypothetical protein